MKTMLAAVILAAFVSCSPEVPEDYNANVAIWECGNGTDLIAETGAAWKIVGPHGEVIDQGQMQGPTGDEIPNTVFWDQCMRT